jgi:hypothetical protein
MNKRLMAGFCVVFALAGPALAQTDADMDKQLDASMGEHRPYAEFFAALQKAINADDKAAVAAMVNYPFVVYSKGGSQQIKDAKHFLANYDRLITPKVKAAVAKQTYATLFTNWQGVMIGDGEIWFSGVGDNLDVKIITIND